MHKHLQKLLLIVAMMLVPWVTQAQDVQDYALATGTDSTMWITLSSSATHVTAIEGEDDAGSSCINIGFTFDFGGTSYTQFSCNSNGRIRLGSTAVSTYWLPPFTTLTDASYNDLPFITAFGMDNTLEGTGSYVKYELTGTAPNRILVIEYYTPSEYYDEGDKVYYQVQLLEGSNKVRLVYGTTAASYYDDYQIGLAKSATDYLMISATTHATVTSTEFTNSSWPGVYRYYELTPVIADCPRLTSLSAHATAGSALLTWSYSTSLGIDPTFFDISYRYTDDTLATPTSIIANDLSYTLTGLDPDTSYTVTVTPYCGTSSTGESRTVVFSTRALSCLEWDTTGSGPVDSTAVGTDGTTTTYYMPVNEQSNYSYCQHLIRTSEITLTNPAMISAVGFQYMYSQPLTEITNCSIYMAHTTLSALTSGSFIPYDSLQLVYVGPLNCDAAGWHYFHFNQGNFAWDGTRNMVIGIVNNSGAHATTSHVFGYHVPTSGSCLRTNNDNTPYGPTNMATSTTTSSWRSNMRLLTGGGDCLQIASCAAPYVVTDSVAEDAVHLTWIPGYQETDWMVEYKTQSATSWTVAAASTTSTDMLIDSLSGNTQYMFRVTALCTDTTLSTTVTRRTLCGVQGLPYTETFESSSTGSSTTGSAFVTCWYRLNNGTSYGGYPYVSNSTTYNHTPGGSRGLYWYNTTTTGTYGDYQCIVMPRIDTVANPINTLQVKFWARSSSTSYSPTFIVGVLTDPEDINTFSQVQEVFVGNSTVWQEYVVDLDVYTGAGSYVAIRANRPGSSWYAYVDDVTLRPIPVCPDVTDVTAEETSPASAIITWRMLGGLSEPTGFEVQYDSVNSTSTPITLNVTDPYAILTGLTPATSYKAKVRALCSSEDGLWDSVTFSTRPLACFELDPATADTVIYSNSTTGQSGCIAYSSWGNTAYQTIWTAAELTAAGLTAGSINAIDLGFTGSSSYAKELTIFLGNSNVTSISNATLENPNAQQQVYGPAAHPMNTSGWQHYEFDVPFTWDGTSSIIMTTFMNQPTGSSHSSSSGITGYYESASNKARYRYQDGTQFTLSNYNSGNSGGTYSYRAAIHFYKGDCMTEATCAEPLVTATRVEPTEVDIMWAPGYTETSWDIDHRLGTSGAWTSDVIGSSASTYTYTALAPNTRYQFRVTAQCSDTTMSTILTITTPCAAMTLLPYTQDFESENTGSSSTSSPFIPCWHRINNGTSYGGYPYVSSSSTYNHTSGGTKGLYWYNTTTTGSYGDYQVVVLPPVDSTIYQVNNLQLTFWAKSSATSYNPVFIVGALTDPDDITTFVGIDTIDVGGNTNWTEFEVPLNNYTGNGTYVALRANRPSSSWYAYVDDFTLDVIPACPRVNDLSQTDATISSITLHWEEIGEATQWIIEYDTVDFIPGNNLAGNTVTSNDTTYTITGLDSSMIYYIYVSADCGGGETSPYRFVLGRTLAGAPAELPYSCNFEGAGTNGWTLLNGSMTNGWYIDSAVNNGGSRSLYISNNGGLSNSYSNSSISYAYATRAINFADSGEFAYSYDWRGVGESHYYDFTRVFLTPYAYQWTENTNPAGSTYDFSQWSCPAGWIEITEDMGTTPNNLAQSANWRTATGTFRLNTPGVYNLVFAWANDGSVGTDPPTAIDNVSIVQNTCPAPIVHVDHTTLDSIAVYWEPGGSESMWLITCDSITTTVFDTFYTFDNLSASTPYTIRVYALCDDGDTSLAGTATARTQCGLISAVPFGDNFNSLSYSSNDHAPECWYGHSTYDSYYPEVADWQDRYNSGQSLYMYMYNPGTAYTIVQLPGVDTNVLPIRTLQVNFSLMSEYGTGGIIVGVCTAQGMVGFTPVDTVIVNEDYMWHDFEVPLTGYYDTGIYITLSQYCPSSDLDIFLDEVNLVLAPNCVRPRNIHATTVSTSDALVRWAPADSIQNVFEVRYGRTGCNVDTLTGIIVTGADSLLITGLDSGVVYDVYVRALCGSGDTSFWTSGMFRTLASSPVSTFPYICDFTSPEGQAWNLENGTETNKWYVGTAAYNGTADNMGLYISDNNGVSNSYNNSSVTFTYAYRTFNMPAGQYAYSFDWRCQGESQYYDFIRVFLAPASDQIIAGQSPGGNTSSYSFGSEIPPTGWIDLSQVTTAPYTLNQQSTWTNLNSTFTLTTGGTYNLVFAWSNDGSGGSNPPAAIDNVQIYRNTCPSPNNFHVSGNTNSSITVDFTGVGTPTGYELSIGTTTGNPTVDTTVTSGPVTFNGLTPGQTYYFYIRTNCDNGSDSSMWVGPILGVPGTWNMRPNQTDTLYMCGGVIYDDAGTNQGYSNSQSSYIILYPDAPNNLVSVSGSYNLESCCDYIRIYDGNSSTGTQLFSSQNTTSGTIGPLLSTNGPLTIYFYTDGSVNTYDGFTLNVSCVSTTCRVMNVRLDTAYAPSDNQLAITWDNNGADFYQVEYGTPGFIPTGSSAVTTYTNSIIITGLTGLTNYDVCVRSICDYGADTGSWTRATFQTAMCANITEVYSYDSTMSITSSSYGPIGYAFYNYSYVQTIIDSAQMAGLTDPISAFAFNPTNTTSSDYYTHMTVYMANVPETSLSGMITPDTNHVFVPVITDATFNFTTVGWQLHGFDTTFTWDGHSNVLFAVNRQHGSYSSSGTFAAHSTSSTRTYYLYQDSGPISITSPSATSSGSGNYIGDLKFFSCGGSGCRQPIITGVTHTYESATITWTGDGTDYEVNIKETAAPNWPATDIHVTGNTYTFTALQPTTSYTFRVRQDCTADSMDYSEWTISGFVTDSLPCLPPDSLTVVGVTNATATLDWVPFGYETMWDVHVWYSGGIDSIYTVSAHPATVGGFTANTTYQASVRPLCGSAHNILGDWGDTITFTTAVCPDVTGLGTSNVTTSSVTVSWTPDPLAIRWILEYGYHGFDLGTGTQVICTNPTYVVNGLLDDMEYDFRVRAVCGDNWQSEGWANVSATTQPGGVPCEAPTGVSAVVAGNAATISWTPNTGNISFEVEYGLRGYGHNNGTTVTATTSPITLPNLEYNTEYDVYVHAICDQNTYSAWSTVVSFTTEPQGSDDCDPVTDLAANNVTESSALLTWTPGPTGDEWEVVLTTSAGVTVTEASTTEHQYALTGLTPGTAYVAKVRTVCGDEQYSTFASVSFTTNTIGIADEDMSGGHVPSCTIYPNPTSSATTISVNGISGKVRIAVVDMNGREVTSETIDCSGDCAKTMEVDRLAQGAYFVRITGENANLVKKLIVR